MTLLDLSLPGTHDTLTYDLSTIVSDGGVDDMILFAQLLHKYEEKFPDSIEDFIRQQAQTQDLDVLEQLDNGVRFLDFRIMYEYSDDQPNWYSLHFMQSNSPAMIYMQQVRAWMDKHPQEIVVMWLSKHGGTNDVGESQYPKTPVAAKQQYWTQIQSLFTGVLTDFSVTKINETTVSDMILRNHRMVIYASDYEEFTSSSQFALDARLIDNQLGPSVDDEIAAQKWERERFANAAAIISADKAKQGFSLVSLSTGVPAASTVMAATIRFLPSYNESQVQRCAAAFNIPGMDWCPQTLLDIAQLENFYKQITLEEAFVTPGWRFPNAIYINAVDWEGTIRTGTQVMWGAKRSLDSIPTHETAAYAYADTIILSNIQLGCGVKAGGAQPVQARVTACADLQKRYQDRREKNPLFLWNDAQFGRLADWPAA